MWRRKIRKRECKSGFPTVPTLRGEGKGNRTGKSDREKLSQITQQTERSASEGVILGGGT